jgi:hypothetical protein
VFSAVIKGGIFPLCHPLFKEKCARRGANRLEDAVCIMAAGCQWLIGVVLAIWEVDIRRIAVRGQTGQIVLPTPSQK